MKNNHNGSNGSVKIVPKVTEILLDSGIRVHVAPLSRYQRNALQERAEQIYPMPDKTLYEEELSEDVAIPGTKIPAEENPEYQNEVGLVLRARSEFISTHMMNLCLTYPDFPGGKEELIAYFATDIAAQREIMNLPDDPWEATLRFAIIRSVADERDTGDIIRESFPITESEVSEAIRVFRPAISREAIRSLDNARKFAPGAEQPLSDKPQS